LKSALSNTSRQAFGLIFARLTACGRFFAVGIKCSLTFKSLRLRHDRVV
jgi:hypothetical protein